MTFIWWSIKTKIKIRCSTDASPNMKTQLSQIKLLCRQYARDNTPTDGKSTHLEECVYPSYGHQNSIQQHFNLTLLLPYCKYLYLCERLSSSLLKQVKRSSYNRIKILLVILMQVKYAIILNPKGILYNAVML